MELAGFAILARSRKDESSAKALFREAFELDHHAANAIAETNLEPSRSVLHRSAATLALDCGELRAAERLIAVGLAGDSPEAVAQELRQLMLRVFDQLGLKQAVGE
ncbi:MAG: hypothetical protein K8L97_34635 [Anaerolineae bacterium]|nr:hypothetical protein [Anaerolineae bacterium]